MKAKGNLPKQFTGVSEWQNNSLDAPRIVVSGLFQSSYTTLQAAFTIAAQRDPATLGGAWTLRLP